MPVMNGKPGSKQRSGASFGVAIFKLTLPAASLARSNESERISKDRYERRHSGKRVVS